MKRPVFAFCLFVLLVMVALLPVSAQYLPDDPGGGADPDGVPISGIEILIGLGGAWGIKRIISLRNSKK